MVNKQASDGLLDNRKISLFPRLLQVTFCIIPSNTSPLSQPEPTIILLDISASNERGIRGTR